MMMSGWWPTFNSYGLFLQFVGFDCDIFWNLQVISMVGMVFMDNKHTLNVSKSRCLVSGCTHSEHVQLSLPWSVSTYTFYFAVFIKYLSHMLGLGNVSQDSDGTLISGATHWNFWFIHIRRMLPFHHVNCIVLDFDRYSLSGPRSWGFSINDVSAFMVIGVF